MKRPPLISLQAMGQVREVHGVARERDRDGRAEAQAASCCSAASTSGRKGSSLASKRECAVVADLFEMGERWYARRADPPWGRWCRPSSLLLRDLVVSGPACCAWHGGESGTLLILVEWMGRARGEKFRHPEGSAPRLAELHPSFRLQGGGVAGAREPAHRRGADRCLPRSALHPRNALSSGSSPRGGRCWPSRSRDATCTACNTPGLRPRSSRVDRITTLQTGHSTSLSASSSPGPCQRR